MAIAPPFGLTRQMVSEPKIMNVLVQSENMMRYGYLLHKGDLAFQHSTMLDLQRLHLFRKHRYPPSFEW